MAETTVNKQEFDAAMRKLVVAPPTPKKEISKKLKQKTEPKR